MNTTNNDVESTEFMLGDKTSQNNHAKEKRFDGPTQGPNDVERSDSNSEGACSRSSKGLKISLVAIAIALLLFAVVGVPLIVTFSTTPAPVVSNSSSREIETLQEGTLAPNIGRAPSVLPTPTPATLQPSNASSNTLVPTTSPSMNPLATLAPIPSLLSNKVTLRDQIKSENQTWLVEKAFLLPNGHGWHAEWSTSTYNDPGSGDVRIIALRREYIYVMEEDGSHIRSLRHPRFEVSLMVILEVIADPNTNELFLLVGAYNFREPTILIYSITRGMLLDQFPFTDASISDCKVVSSVPDIKIACPTLDIPGVVLLSKRTSNIDSAGEWKEKRQRVNSEVKVLSLARYNDLNGDARGATLNCMEEGGQQCRIMVWSDEIVPLYDFEVGANYTFTQMFSFTDPLLKKTMLVVASSYDTLQVFSSEGDLVHTIEQGVNDFDIEGLFQNPDETLGIACRTKVLSVSLTEMQPTTVAKFGHQKREFTFERYGFHSYVDKSGVVKLLRVTRIGQHSSYFRLDKWTKSGESQTFEPVLLGSFDMRRIHRIDNPFPAENGAKETQHFSSFQQPSTGGTALLSSSAQEVVSVSAVNGTLKDLKRFKSQHAIFGLAGYEDRNGTSWLVFGKKKEGEFVVELWNMSSGKIQHVLPERSGGITALKVVDDVGGEDYIISASEDGGIRVWSAATKLLVREWNATYAIHSLSTFKRSDGTVWIAVGSEGVERGEGSSFRVQTYTLDGTLRKEVFPDKVYEDTNTLSASQWTYYHRPLKSIALFEYHGEMHLIVCMEYIGTQVYSLKDGNVVDIVPFWGESDPGFLQAITYTTGDGSVRVVLRHPGGIVVYSMTERTFLYKVGYGLFSSGYTRSPLLMALVNSLDGKKRIAIGFDGIELFEIE